jgi:phage-related protein (TIGR01555 family)
MQPPDPLMSGLLWGDSVLQPVNDAVKMCGLVSGSLATLISELKIDIIKIPDMAEIVSTAEGTQKLQTRFATANAMKSVINTVVLDASEEWQRVQANLAGVPEIIVTYLQIASGAADIPAGRFLGLPHKGLNTTGEADARNYYDKLAGEQTTVLTPAMSVLDEVIIRSALGTRPPEIYYEWASLWQLSDGDKADIALKKAQAYQVDVNAGQIPAVALANGRVNQLIEDGTYPGLQKALEDAAAEGDTIEELNAPQAEPVGTMLLPGEHLAPPDPNAPVPAATPLPPPARGNGQTGDLPRS